MLDAWNSKKQDAVDCRKFYDTSVCFDNLEDFTSKKSSSWNSIPKDVDVLIYAGDMSLERYDFTPDKMADNQREIIRFINWFKAERPSVQKIIVGGNHDSCFDENYLGCDLYDDVENCKLAECNREKIMNAIGRGGHGVDYLESECRIVSVPGKGSIRIFGSPLSDQPPQPMPF